MQRSQTTVAAKQITLLPRFTSGTLKSLSPFVVFLARVASQKYFEFRVPLIPSEIWFTSNTPRVTLFTAITRGRCDLACARAPRNYYDRWRVGRIKVVPLAPNLSLVAFVAFAFRVVGN